MALIVYPTEGYDSFVDLIDANTTIAEYTLFSPQWLALTDTVKETYLRIATDRILNKIDTSLLIVDPCISKSCSIMAAHDLVFEISSSINPNTGLITKEKVGDLEVTYTHGNAQRQLKSRNTDPFPSTVKPCLSEYGAVFSLGVSQATIGKA